MSKSAASSLDDSASLFLRLLRRLRLGDYLVAFVFVALALGSMLGERVLFHDSSATRARVLVRNETLAEIGLQHADTITVQGTLGAVTLVTSAGNIRVLASSCANKVCVRQGAIRRPHQMLVCAPNHLVVTLTGAKKNDLDAVTF